MFGECFDFAPVPTRGSRRQYIAPVLATQQQHQRTPKEQANQLAAAAGIDPTLLDGICNKLLEGLKVADIRAGMQYACSALQLGTPTGKAATDHSEASVGDFLVTKIERLPLGTRFPLMAEWTARMPAAWSTGQLAPKAVPLEANFVSFGGGRDGEGPSASARSAEEGKKKKEKKRKPLPVQESYLDEDTVDPIRPEPVVTRLQPAPPVETRKAVFEEISLDNEQMKREAVRREEEAKNTASKVLINLQQTKAAVEAGRLAARQSSQISSDYKSKDEGEKGLNRQREPRGGKRVQYSDEIDELNEHRKYTSSRSCSRSRQEYSRRGAEYDHEGRNNRDRRARSHNDGSGYDQDRRSYSYDERYDRGGRCARDTDHETRGSHRYDRRDSESYRDDRGRRGGRAEEYQVRDDSRSRSHDGGRRPYASNSFIRHADRRSCSREGRDAGGQHSRDRRGSRSEVQDGPARTTDSHEAGGKQEVDPANKRKKHLMDLFQGMRSESPEREGQRRKADTAENERKQASGKQGGSHSHAVARAFENLGNPSGIDEKRVSKTPVSGVLKTAAPQEAAKAPPKKEPKLRQLAFKNGWAEYVEEGTGQHVYKNVFTGEMTKTKPAELAPQITEAQNMRRLQWLSTHRQAQMMSDMALMGGHMPPM